MTPVWHIRRATEADATLFSRQRVAMFRDMGRTTPDIEGPLFDVCQRHFADALASMEYVGWVAERAGPHPTAIGGGGVQFRPLVPRTDPSGRTLLVGREGLILNVYVDPEYRRQGIARALMQAILDWAPGAGIVRLVLHASDDGRALYETLGFRASNEMLFPPFLPPLPQAD